MSSISSGPSDAQVRRSNEDALLLRAQTQLGAEAKKAANQAVRPEEDQVTLQGNSKVKTDGSDKLAAAAAASASVSTSADPSNSASVNSSQDGGQTPPPSNGSQAPPSNDSQNPPPGQEQPQFTDAQTAFLESATTSSADRSKERDMWRTLWADWMERQMKWLEDLENFRQSVYVMWQEVAVSRWVQGQRHAEAVRSLL